MDLHSPILPKTEQSLYLRMATHEVGHHYEIKILCIIGSTDVPTYTFCIVGM